MHTTYWVMSIGGIEEVELSPPYALIVAAASLHWMPWHKTLPRFAQSVSSNGYLAIVEGRTEPNPWSNELKPIFAHYSMNQDFQPYNMLTVADELERHGLFERVDVVETQPISFQRSIGAWIEATHSQNGFSRDRMDSERAAEFDRCLRDVLTKHCPNGEVEEFVSARIIYGKL